MCIFTRIGPKTKKVMAFDNSRTKAVLSASPGPTPKRCEQPLFLAALGQVIYGWKALDLGNLNVQFQQDWPKDEQITADTSNSCSLVTIFCSRRFAGLPPGFGS